MVNDQADMMAPPGQTYRPPNGERVLLAVKPRLASWMAKGHHDQVLLETYLEAFTAVLDPHLEGLPESLVLELAVDVRSAPTQRGGDLDNYLYPVVEKLGPKRFASVWGIKHSAASTVRVGAASPTPLPEGDWHKAVANTAQAAGTAAWKHLVAAQIQEHVATPVLGALELHVALTVHPQRNWASLWKPTIDALGAVLGLDDVGKPFHPNDDRILVLGLHRTINDAVGDAIRIDVAWRPTPQPHPSMSPETENAEHST